MLRKFAWRGFGNNPQVVDPLPSFLFGLVAATPILDGGNDVFTRVISNECHIS